LEDAGGLWDVSGGTEDSKGVSLWFESY